MNVETRANLNKSYFTNRQDRYIHFSSHAHLAQYCFEFLRTISTFSYKLLPSASDLTPHSYQHEGYTLHWPDPQTHPHQIHQKAEAALSEFQTAQRGTNVPRALPVTPHPTNNQAEPSLHASPSDIDNVLLFPIIQAGQFNIRQEEEALSLLFRHLKPDPNSTALSNSRPLVDLTSGYFGLYQPYQDLVLVSNVNTRIVAASPKVCARYSLRHPHCLKFCILLQANGFFGSKGISGRIPEGYTLLEQRFMRAVEMAGLVWNNTVGRDAGKGVQLTEWEREGWTYHAKGKSLTSS